MFFVLVLLFGFDVWHLAVADVGRKLIPRKLLLGDADHMMVRISGDGRWLTYVAPFDGVQNVYAQRLPDGVPYAITRVKNRGVSSYWWLYDNHTILYSRDNDGDENWMLRTVDLNSGVERPLTDSAGVRTKFLARSASMPDTIVIGTNDRDGAFYDAYLVDVPTGKKTLLFLNDLYKELWFDKQLRLRLASNETDDAFVQYYLLEQDLSGGDPSAHTARLHRALDADSSMMSEPLNFNVDGKTLYWLKNEERDLTALIAENLETGESRVIYEPEMGDISTVLDLPVSGEPAIVYEDYLLPESYVIMPRLARPYERLKASFPEGSIIDVTATTLDFQKWTISVSSDTVPSTYYLCDMNKETKPCTFLFHTLPKLLNYTMSPMKAVQVKTRDNLTEVCYFTFPYDSVDAAGFPRHPLPTVVYVHGGPWAQDGYEFNKPCQFLANRGYAVMRCNFRGSIGYGKQMLAAGNGEWGRKMQYDLLDAIEWAVERNFSLRDKIAIYGGSYGGYAALAGLAFTPDTFACGIDIVGPSNLLTLIESLPSYWKPEYNTLIHRLGASPDTEEGRQFLNNRSPLNFASHIKKPLLIAQGANDPRVKRQESDQIVDALRSQNLSVTYLLYPNEGHGFARAANRLALWTYIEHFLRHCLGGVVQPVGSDLDGANLEVNPLSHVNGSHY